MHDNDLVSFVFSFPLATLTCSCPYKNEYLEYRFAKPFIFFPFLSSFLFFLLNDLLLFLFLFYHPAFYFLLSNFLRKYTYFHSLFSFSMFLSSLIPKLTLYFSPSVDLFPLSPFFLHTNSPSSFFFLYIHALFFFPLLTRSLLSPCLVSFLLCFANEPRSSLFNKEKHCTVATCPSRCFQALPQIRSGSIHRLRPHLPY
ncbi:unnamed protein product [Acanthosepion pharaonis]|uniref:Uncharacterized protein n=1 Tax=Acanthosepion pharaonis TaxID=158019 RepID=A0A812BQU3_ACAPH|nr:unnamed protein product [Sepia pharaonis]